jgi:hypothetical protein
MRLQPQTSAPRLTRFGTLLLEPNTLLPDVGAETALSERSMSGAVSALPHMQICNTLNTD